MRSSVRHSPQVLCNECTCIKASTTTQLSQTVSCRVGSRGMSRATIYDICVCVCVRTNLYTCMLVWAYANQQVTGGNGNLREPIRVLAKISPVTRVVTRLSTTLSVAGTRATRLG